MDAEFTTTSSPSSLPSHGRPLRIQFTTGARKKDELDLILLAEQYPTLKSTYPAELRDQIDRG